MGGMSAYMALLAAAFSSSIVFLLVFLMRGFSIPRRQLLVEKSFRDGKYALAIKHAHAVLAKDPHNWAVRVLLGRAHLAEGKRDVALMELRAASSRAAFGTVVDEVEFRKTIAQLYLQFDQIEEALKEYTLLIRLDPTCADYHYRIGQLFERKNVTDRAAAYYRQCIGMDAAHPAAHAALGSLLLRSGHLVEARAELDTVLALEPANAEALFCQGQLLRKEREYAAALRSFEQASRSPVLRQKCFTERGCCYMDAKDVDRAIVEFDRALRCKSQSGENEDLQIRYLLASCYEKKRDVEKAIEQWEAINARSAGFKDVTIKLAQYQDIRLNDRMKEYLTLDGDSFFDLCQRIVSKALRLSIDSVQDVRGCCEIVATERDEKGWSNVRTQPKVVVFYREARVLDDSFLRAILERMKERGIARGVVVTSSSFSRAALSFAENRPLELLGKNELERLLDASS
nr:tetratricopeptide repeat protein [Treponema pallidum]